MANTTSEAPNPRRRQFKRFVGRGQVSRDPASEVASAPPNMGRAIVPQIITFSGEASGFSHVYRSPDEAIRHSRDNARHMRNDPSIMECLEARQRATALLNWHIEPESPKDPKQKQLATDVTNIIKRIPQFTEYRRNLLEALWAGRAAVQHRWGFKFVEGKRRTTVVDWTPVHGDKLVFRFDDGTGKFIGSNIGIRVGTTRTKKDAIAGDRKLEMTDWGMAYFLEEWERPLLAVHKHIIEDGAFEDPLSAGRIHGVGIRDRIYWCWFQKQETMAHLMEVIERTGMGFTIYYYPYGNDQAKQDVEQMAKEQARDNVILMPRMSGDPSMDAYGIERIEPSSAGIDALKMVIHEFFGHQIKRYILGQILSSESAATGLGSGVADLHQDTFYGIIAYDAVKLEETITEELVRWIVEYNFPWARNIHLRFKIDTEANEADRKLEAAKKAWDMGAKLKASDVMDLIGFSTPTADDEVLQNPSMQQQQRLWEASHGGGGDPGMGGGPGTDGGGDFPPGSPEDSFGPLMGLLQQGGPQQGPQQYAKRRYSALSEAVEAAAKESARNPSDAQKEAGNYRKGKVTLHGMPVTIENAKGSRRRPEWPPLAAHYGYINRTEGRDGDHVDVFIGPNPESEIVFVVDQVTEGGRFDEHKCMLGYTSQKEAKEAYLANYTPGWKVGPITALTIPQFRAWLESGDTFKAVAKQVSRYEKNGMPASPADLQQHQVGETKNINGVNYRLNQNHRWERAEGNDDETQDIPTDAAQPEDDHKQRLGFVKKQLANVHPQAAGIMRALQAAPDFERGAEYATQDVHPKQAAKLYQWLQQNAGNNAGGGLVHDFGEGRIGYATKAGSIIVWPEANGTHQIAYTAKTGIVDRAMGKPEQPAQEQPQNAAGLAETTELPKPQDSGEMPGAAPVPAPQGPQSPNPLTQAPDTAQGPAGATTAQAPPSDSLDEDDRAFVVQGQQEKAQRLANLPAKPSLSPKVAKALEDAAKKLGLGTPPTITMPTPTKPKRVKDAWKLDVKKHVQAAGLSDADENISALEEAIADGHITSPAQLKRVIANAKKLHEKGNMAQGDAPAVQEATRRRRNRSLGSPRQSFDAVLRQHAQDWEIDESTLRQVVDDVWKERLEYHNEREQAKEAARIATGLTQRDINLLENQGYDSGSDHPKTRRLDDIGRQFASQFPILGWGRGADDDSNAGFDSADYAEQMWNLLREGNTPAPSKTSDEFWGEVNAYLNRQQGGGEELSEEDRKRRREELDAIPFSKSRFREWLTRYARTPRSSQGQRGLFGGDVISHKQRAIDWKEEEHPRDESGQFTEKEAIHAAVAVEQNPILQEAIGESQPDAPEPVDQWQEHLDAEVAPPMSKMKPEWFHGTTTGDGRQKYDVTKNPDGTYKVTKSFVGGNSPPMHVSDGKDAEGTMNNIWRSGSGLTTEQVFDRFKAGVLKDREAAKQQDAVPQLSENDSSKAQADNGVPDELVQNGAEDPESAEQSTEHLPEQAVEQPTEQPAPPSSFDPANHIKIAADSIEKLRKQDVYRVLDQVDPKNRAAVADYVRKNRPELADEVNESLADLGEPAPAADSKPEGEGVTEEQAKSRKWTKNEDGTYTSPNGTIWKKAAAGGEVSPVTGEHFKGGSLMPIHGLAQKQPKADGKGTASGDSKPKEDGKKQTRPVQQVSPEMIEAERERRENEARWTKVRDGHIGQLLPMGERPHYLKSTVTGGGTRRWENMVADAKLSPEQVKELADHFEKKATDAVLAKEGEGPEQAASYLENANLLIDGGKAYWRKGKLKSHPDMPRASHFVSDYLNTGGQGEKLLELHESIEKLKRGESLNPEGKMEKPQAPTSVKPSTIDTPAQGSLQQARKAKADAWKQVKALREQLKNEPMKGNSGNIRLKLIKAETAHREAMLAEKKASQAIEGRANELGQTTKSPRVQSAIAEAAKKLGIAQPSDEKPESSGGEQSVQPENAGEFVSKGEASKSEPPDAPAAVVSPFVRMRHGDHEFKSMPAEVVPSAGGTGTKVNVKPGGHVVIEYPGFGYTEGELRSHAGQMVEDFFKREYSGLAEQKYGSKGFWRATNNVKEPDLAASGQIRNSVNHADGSVEAGVSVAEHLGYAGNGGHKIVYRVTGDVVGTGSDGEPVLDPKSMRVVKVYKGKDREKLFAEDAELFDKALAKHHWNREQYLTAINNGLKFFKGEEFWNHSSVQRYRDNAEKEN